MVLGRPASWDRIPLCESEIGIGDALTILALDRAEQLGPNPTPEARAAAAKTGKAIAGVAEALRREHPGLGRLDR